MSIQPPSLDPIIYEYPGLVIEVCGTPDAPHRTWDELIAAAIPGMARLLMEPTKKEEPCQAGS